MLGDARDLGDLGRCLCADLTEREVDWMLRREWALNADDILWRRSKLGLRVRPAEAAGLRAYLSGAPGRMLDRIAGEQTIAAATQQQALGLR